MTQTFYTFGYKKSRLVFHCSKLFDSAKALMRTSIPEISDATAQLSVFDITIIYLGDISSLSSILHSTQSNIMKRI
ncbi:hypothetical protein V512_009920 [Mesotoga sp. Brook.08.105.5.1]|nr:hypothetical protein V512_009920 [Mesotoga sp. Brook.08.105.5.1]